MSLQAMTERTDSSFVEAEVIVEAVSADKHNDQEEALVEDDSKSASSKEDLDISKSEGVQQNKAKKQELGSSSHSIKEPKNAAPGEDKQIDQPVRAGSKPVASTYGETDPEMGALAEQMNRAIGFSATPATRVQVRKGYLFDLEVSGPEFWEKHDDIWSNRKRKRDERREQRHGFFAADIIRYGAVDMLSPRPPNLTNEIHPLYQRNAFTGCEDEVYEQFVPALRLASMWMTVCSQFWVTLARGHREVDEAMSLRFGRLQHRIRQDVPLTKENASEVMDYIKDISKDYRMSFTFQDNFKRNGATYFGGTNKVCDVGWSDSDRPSNQLLRIYTKLSSDYYVAAKKLSQLKYPDLAQVLRFQFGLAVLLVHETSHAIELAHIRRRPDIVPDEAYDPYYQQWIGHEPYLYDSVRPELGLTWEMYMFGGRILPINDRVDCLHGLCVFDWPDKNAPFDLNSREVHTIPMTYIERMFQMSTWEQEFDMSKKDLWHIPRNGAKSIYLTHFTTMSYDEEQRIKDEEAAEALKAATGKWEKPADKKRRTSLEGEVLVAATSTPVADQEPPEEIRNDKDKLWKAALDYLRAQPRKSDTSLQDENDWPEWVKHSLRNVGAFRQNQAQDSEDEVLSSRTKQKTHGGKPRSKSRKPGVKSARKGDAPQHYTASARAVGLGSGKRR